MTESMLFSLFIGTLFALFISLVAFRQEKKYQWELENRYKILLSFHRIYQLILENLDYESMVQRIADIIPNELKFATGVLVILDEKTGTLKRIAASQTTQAAEAIKFINTLSVPFEKIEISVNDPNNIMAKAMRERKPLISTDIYDVLGPVLPKEETKKVQEIMGTKTTFVYPISIKNYPIGVFIASTKKQHKELSSYELEVMNTFVNLIGLALQDSQLYTSLKNTTGRLEIVNKRLHELDRLKDDFVSIASHELRTPMAAIRSYAWMALHRSGMSLSPNMEKYLARILISTERLINLVNDMLNVSRIESGRIEINPEPIDVISLIKDIVDEVYYSKSEEKSIEFIVMSKQVPKVFADPEKLRQVLLNLVGNSLKFTPSGGKITFDTFSDGKVVEISVSDTGVGISKEDMSKLFQKFSRLDNSYTAAATSGGTGLGLYISKNLVELMHGRIKVSSEGLNRGTTFTVSLPVASIEAINEIDKYSVKAQGEAKGLEPVAI